MLNNVARVYLSDVYSVSDNVLRCIALQNRHSLVSIGVFGENVMISDTLKEEINSMCVNEVFLVVK